MAVPSPFELQICNLFCSTTKNGGISPAVAGFALIGLSAEHQGRATKRRGHTEQTGDARTEAVEADAKANTD